MALHQAAMQQRQRVLDALRKAPESGRVAVHIRTDRKDFAGSPDDIELRAGDSLAIPKQPGAVLVIGQVYNSNALTYAPGRNAGWYLSHSGGPTKLADKGAIFIVRADGSVSSGKQGGFWSGSVLSTAMGPATPLWCRRGPFLADTLKNVLTVAQIASSAVPAHDRRKDTTGSSGGSLCANSSGSVGLKSNPSTGYEYQESSAVSAKSECWDLGTCQCRLIWLILHQGVRYQERGPAVTKQSRQNRPARVIRQLRRLGYRIEPPNPRQAQNASGAQRQGE